MNNRNIIKLALAHLSIIDLIAYLFKVYAKMNGNVTFLSLAAKTTALNTATLALETANTNYNAASLTATALMKVRDNAVIVAEAAAQDLANGAEGVTKDPATLQTGGWEIAATHGTPVGPMIAPPFLTATSGDNVGEVDLSWDTQYGVQTHIGESAPSPDGPWTQFYLGKKSSCTSSGNVSGSLMWFRVAASGAAGQGPYSGPISKRAT